MLSFLQSEESTEVQLGSGDCLVQHWLMFLALPLNGIGRPVEDSLNAAKGDDLAGTWGLLSLINL